MNFLHLIGRVFLENLGTAGQLTSLAADDTLHPSEKVYTPWADTIVSQTESALLKEDTP